jgi:hypothetical protein
LLCENLCKERKMVERLKQLSCSRNNVQERVKNLFHDIGSQLKADFTHVCVCLSLSCSNHFSSEARIEIIKRRTFGAQLKKI